MSEYVTVSQLASELNVSVHRVYRRIYRGDIKADYVHSRYPHYVIARDEVQRFKDAGGMKAMNPPLRFNPFMAVSEVALRSGLTPERIRRLCVEGVLRYERDGARGRYRIRKDSAEAFLAGLPADPYR